MCALQISLKFAIFVILQENLFCALRTKLSYLSFMFVYVTFHVWKSFII